MCKLKFDVCWSITPQSLVCIDLTCSKMNRNFSWWRLGNNFLQFLVHLVSIVSMGSGKRLTRLSKTHLLSLHSFGRHCHSCWLLSSRQVQCFRNSSRQDLLISSILWTVSIWALNYPALSSEQISLSERAP